jgi:hypothetical protein
MLCFTVVVGKNEGNVLKGNFAFHRRHSVYEVSEYLRIRKTHMSRGFLYKGLATHAVVFAAMKQAKPGKCFPAIAKHIEAHSDHA